MDVGWHAGPGPVTLRAMTRFGWLMSMALVAACAGLVGLCGLFLLVHRLGGNLAGARR